ncbi:arf-GAP with Rho-GAP domain, ANK repeat and PH domain-containing protein 1 isoform X1 [Acipenser oxyrinchus oxyrinchus]|uniref:Arf-GAP with Rho-GAP domain, ANK repeat and PH domain-containing protein 1 isoform X1 n=1 Tax=Acipenser oxyrinchus oxyrinchus TaxID=40147 RepID=A0AAD8DDZ8_ACIOX|nr:arf-GAP with Rho-GAP domain, ANK repeat and PH domain-containing protein 1 isoform X1 [Acipenser oxyrinchus oxyrinchus]
MSKPLPGVVPPAGQTYPVPKPRKRTQSTLSEQSTAPPVPQPRRKSLCSILESEMPQIQIMSSKEGVNSKLSSPVSNETEPQPNTDGSNEPEQKTNVPKIQHKPSTDPSTESQVKPSADLSNGSDHKPGADLSSGSDHKSSTDLSTEADVNECDHKPSSELSTDSQVKPNADLSNGSDKPSNDLADDSNDRPIQDLDTESDDKCSGSLTPESRVKPKADPSHGSVKHSFALPNDSDDKPSSDADDSECNPTADPSTEPQPKASNYSSRESETPSADSEASEHQPSSDCDESQRSPSADLSNAPDHKPAPDLSTESPHKLSSDLSQDSQSKTSSDGIAETQENPLISETDLQSNHQEDRLGVTEESGEGGVRCSMCSASQEGTTESGQPKTQDSRISQPGSCARHTASMRVSRRMQRFADCQMTAVDQPREQKPRGGSVVCRSGWLEVWQARRHKMMWVEFNGKTLSMFKKRTDKFTETVFPVSCITNVWSGEGCKFLVSTLKKQYEFLTASEGIRDGWVSSLGTPQKEATLEQIEHHGPLALRELRTKVYAVLRGHRLWVYRNKEDFREGVAMTAINMNVSQAKQTGRHSFDLTTPYKIFSFTADSSRELVAWLGSLSQAVKSALSCSEVAQRVWASTWNQNCADCWSPDPEWASVNLLVVICDNCAGQHRAMGTAVSKVRSLKMDKSVWKEPLIQLFILFGNKSANELWGDQVPPAEQICPESSAEQRRAFVWAKYKQGRYRQLHPLYRSQEQLHQRLCEVGMTADVSETLALLCSGARVSIHPGEPSQPSPISLAEQAGQAMQAELLRQNQFTEAPFQDVGVDPSPPENRSVQDTEEFQGKLDKDKLVFSEEVDSAPCEVLNLKDVTSLCDCSTGQRHEFVMQILKERLQCSADDQETLRTHLRHIAKVLLPWPVQDSELAGVRCLSRVTAREGKWPEHRDAWAALRGTELLLYLTGGRQRDRLRLTLSQNYTYIATENMIEIISPERTLSLRFKHSWPCEKWGVLLKEALQPPPSSPAFGGGSLYPSPGRGSTRVPDPIERCISHITQHGLTVEGIYRRCGHLGKISRLVEGLHSTPCRAQFEKGELGVVDVSGALKQCLRLHGALFPEPHLSHWLQSAAIPEQAERLLGYREVLEQLSDEQRDILSRLFGHLYQVQAHSQVNRMTPQNLALVFMPTLFPDQALSTDAVNLTRELITHYTALFHGGEEEASLSHLFVRASYCGNEVSTVLSTLMTEDMLQGC